MLLRRSLLPLLILSAALWARPAKAQNFLMQSAETINDGNFKLGAYPVVLFGKNGADDAFGAAGRFGYGFTDNFDMEAKVAVFGDFVQYGLDAELWVVKGKTDVSLSLGAHKNHVDEGKGNDSSEIDTALLVSGAVTHKLDLYAGFTASFGSLDDIDNSGFQRYYLVPGLEYKLHPDLDLVAEVGIGLNDNSPHYVGAGLSFYIR